jgi:poly(A)-specific ribonuclease
MEVDAASFPYHLLGLFVNISEADFVSFDLELSGIPSRIPNKKPRPGGGKFTLEERYAETREGANRYHILQVGITCARFDYIANKYVLRPYNINLSPLVDEKIDIEREMSLQGGAVTFLLGCGFDIAKPFTHGVQYLSREEAAQVTQATSDRLDKKNQPADLQLKESDVESLDFLRRTREAIDLWKVSNTESCVITTHTGLREKPPVSVISRFEKRLVHQLVRAEYPNLVTIGRSECVRIIYHDPHREADNARRIKARVQEQIARQTGFRWIFEALAGGELDSAYPMPFTKGEDFRDRYDRAIERLRKHQPALVGHNMFTDIVYLYRTFVGQLPETLQGFQDAIHDLFPKIVDTKYLATHAEGDLNASPTLQEIAEGLSQQPLPNIVTHPDHSKYQEHEAFHEAGYDSLLTATIMIRLAAKLGAQQEKQSNPLTGVTKASTPPLPDDNTQIFIRDGREKVHKPVPLPPIQAPEPLTGRQKRRQNRKKHKPTPEARAHTKNIFESLREMRLDPDANADANDTADADASSPPESPTLNFDDTQDAPAGSWANDIFVQDKSGWVPLEQSSRRAMELMPAFDAPLWREFGNTLRVFGTEEGVLKIADW